MFVNGYNATPYLNFARTEMRAQVLSIQLGFDDDWTPIFPSCLLFGAIFRITPIICEPDGSAARTEPVFNDPSCTA